MEARLRPAPTDTVNDVGVQVILTPRDTVDSGEVITPTATVCNYGTQPATFPVTVAIGTGYSATETLTLEPASSETVAFNSWVAQPAGNLTVLSFTQLSGDENPENDTAIANVFVRGRTVHDVGITEIIAPVGTVSSGDTVIPRARVHNFGTFTERYFDVRFRIGAVYSRTLTVNTPLLPDSTLELSFPSWRAIAGTYPVSCSTMLGIDANRTNDRLSHTITVSLGSAIWIAPDRVDAVKTGETKSYRFLARLEGGTGDIVELRASQPPPGWRIALYDSVDRTPLADNDLDGNPDLGPVLPESPTGFTVRISAPAAVVGEINPADTITLSIQGFLKSDTLINDRAFLKILLIPPFDVHNFPNPFSSKTTFVIGLPEPGSVTLTVFNRAGEQICRILDSEPLSPGTHYVPWDGKNNLRHPVAPGTYDYLIEYRHADRVERIVKKLVIRVQ